MSPAGDVAIAILTYRRPAHLERAIQSAIAQNGPVDEILVVDNGADESLRDWLHKRFPEVRYVPMPYNGGTEGRNGAMRAARAGLLITIDDDVEFIGADCARLVRRNFDRDAALACLNFKILDSAGQTLHRDWCHPRPLADCDTEFETYFITEGACAFRREAAIAAGGYAPNFFLGHEGIDLAYRLIDRDLRVAYTPEIKVAHHVARENRATWRQYYYYTRNGVWVAYRNFGAMRALMAAVENTAKMGFFALRAGHPLAYLQGLAAAIRELPRIDRHPLRATSRLRLRMMRERRPSLRDRVWRHLKERLI